MRACCKCRRCCNEAGEPAGFCGAGGAVPCLCLAGTSVCFPAAPFPACEPKVCFPAWLRSLLTPSLASLVRALLTRTTCVLRAAF